MPKLSSKSYKTILAFPRLRQSNHETKHNQNKTNHFTSRELLELELLELDHLANGSQNVGVTHFHPIPPLHLDKVFRHQFRPLLFPPVISSSFSSSSLSLDSAESWATSSSSPLASESVAASNSLLDIKQDPCQNSI